MNTAKTPVGSVNRVRNSAVAFHIQCSGLIGEIVLSQVIVSKLLSVGGGGYATIELSALDRLNSMQPIDT